MRLARTAAPLPRNLAGWSRTSGLRFPKPAGWPSFPTARSERSTTVESNHADSPDQSGASPAGPSSMVQRRRQGIAPCSTGSRPEGSLLALRRSALDGDRTRLTRETAGSHQPDASESRKSGRRIASAAKRPTSGIVATRDPLLRIARLRVRGAPSGIRTRVAGVRDRHPRPLDDRGVKAATAGLEPASSG